MMGASATSAADGTFSVNFPSSTCPAGQTSVETYITAIGGNAGGAGSNPVLGMMALLGPCNTVAQGTYVTINELTTVAAQWALAQFIDSSGQMIGAPGTNLTGLNNGYTLAINDLANPTSGGPGSILAAPSCSGGSPVNCGVLTKMDTVANILAGCDSSTGAASAACTKLFSDTGIMSPGSGASLAAAHTIATDLAMTPTVAADLFSIQTSSTVSKFLPDLSSAPPDWVMALNYTKAKASGTVLFNTALAIAIDGAGNALVADANNFYAVGSFVSKLGPGGSPPASLFTNSDTRGDAIAGTSPDGVAIDASGNILLSTEIGVVKLNANGVPATGSTLHQCSFAHFRQP
jgi:hypothetical protein